MSVRELTVRELEQVSGGENDPVGAAAQAAVDNYGSVQGAIGSALIGEIFGGPPGTLIGAGIGTLVGYGTQAYATAAYDNANNSGIDPFSGEGTGSADFSNNDHDCFGTDAC